MEDILKLAANYGFPMIIACYLLVRLEPLIKDLQKSVVLLTFVVARQSDIDIEQMQKILDVKNRPGGSG
ncbi:MAG: YvrJ family protein [Desulfotomaculum sp.]|nr:YvrJ family protein [Desulfotomaculum sp.]